MSFLESLACYSTPLHTTIQGFKSDQKRERQVFKTWMGLAKEAIILLTIWKCLSVGVAVSRGGA